MSEAGDEAVGSRPGEWRRDRRHDGSSRPPSSGGAWPYLLAALVLGIAAALIALVLRLRRPPEVHFVALPITEYNDRRLPPVAFGRQDGTALLHRLQPSAPSLPFGSQFRGPLQKELDHLAEVRDRPVVVYLCGLARTEGGEIYLLPGDASLEDRGTWLSLEEVLRTLARAEAPTLLLLDLARPIADPYRGVLRDDVAARLPALVERVGAPRLLVLTACAPGQLSLVSEELQRSVFVHYLEQGLGGAAGGYADRRPRGRLTVADLAEYVRDHTDRWAAMNRGARQTPQLLGTLSARDFELLVTDAGRAAAPETEARTYPPALEKAWQKRDDVAEEARLVAPLELRTYEAALVRAELAWRGGLDDAEARKGLTEPGAELDRRLTEARRRLAHPEPRSLAAALRQKGIKADPALDEAMRDLVQRVDRLADDKMRDEKVKAAVTEFVEKTVKDRAALDLAGAVFRVAAEAPNPRPPQLALFHSVLTSLKKPPEPYVETEFLGRLARLPFDPMKPGAFPSGPVHLALRAVGRGEEAAVINPRLLPFVRATVEAGDERRRPGEALLFAEAPDPVRAASLFQQALTRYQQAAEMHAELHKARELYDRAVSFLPEALPYLAALPETRGRDAAWRGALDASRKLGALLADEKASLDDIRSAAAALSGPLESLRQPFDAAELQRRAKQSSTGNAGLLRDLEAALTTPTLRARDRVALWKAAREMGRSLHGETDRLDQAESASRKPVTSPGEAPTEAGKAEERTAAARRAQLTIDFLAYAGLTEDEPRWRAELAKAAANDDAATWDALGRSLRGAWRQKLPERGRPPAGGAWGRKELLAAEGRSFMLYALEPRDRAPSEGPIAPVLALRLGEAEAYYEWLAARARQESASDVARRAAEDYRRAAEEYRRARR